MVQGIQSWQGLVRLGQASRNDEGLRQARRLASGLPLWILYVLVMPLDWIPILIIALPVFIPVVD